MKPYYQDRHCAIYHGDVRTIAASIGVFDAALCDPPYHLTTGKRGGTGVASLNPASPAGRSRIGTGFMGQAWDGGGVAFEPETWAGLPLKPGAVLLAFGGTRTFHRLTCAIEDGGFEVRDCLMWLYGSGFPKSLNISKAIDKAAGAERDIVSEGSPVKRMIPGADQDRTGSWIKDNGRVFVPSLTAPATDAARQWSGYGTALKPSYEPIILAMKPLEGTFAANALAHGVAGLNIDGCRVEGGERPLTLSPPKDGKYPGEFRQGGVPAGTTTAGRFPANLILDEHAGAMLDEQTGTLTSGAWDGNRNVPKLGAGGIYGKLEGKPESPRRGDSGGASRFFYTAKASKAERNLGGADNSHPCVKPLDLIQYLARLILPPKRETPRRLLVPFSGSGSEVYGALRAGWDEVVGIEVSEDYCAIAAQRLSPGGLFGGAL